MLKSGLVNMSNYVQIVTICTHIIVVLCVLLRCASHNYNRFAALLAEDQPQSAQGEHSS
jgi:hypothetical protein